MALLRFVMLCTTSQIKLGILGWYVQSAVHVSSRSYRTRFTFSDMMPAEVIVPNPCGETYVNSGKELDWPIGCTSLDIPDNTTKTINMLNIAPHLRVEWYSVVSFL